VSDWTKVLITGDASGEVVGIQLAKRRRRPFAKFVRYILMGPCGDGGRWKYLSWLLLHTLIPR